MIALAVGLFIGGFACIVIGNWNAHIEEPHPGVTAAGFVLLVAAVAFGVVGGLEWFVSEVVA